MGKFCMNCGTELSYDDKFCPSCGQKVLDIDDLHNQAQADASASTNNANDAAGNMADLKQQFSEGIEKLSSNAAPVVNQVGNQVSNAYNSASETLKGKLEQAKSDMESFDNAAPKKRNFWEMFLLTAITIGIYGLYWSYFFVKDLKKMAGDDAIMNYIPATLLSFVTFGLYAIYYNLKMGKVVNRIQDNYGVPGMRVDFAKYITWAFICDVIGIFFPPLILVVLVIMCVFLSKLIEEFNRAVDYYHA